MDTEEINKLRIKKKEDAIVAKKNKIAKLKEKEVLQEKWKLSSTKNKDNKVERKYHNTTKLSDTFEPKMIEEKIYNEWMNKNYFSSDYNSNATETFMLILPPPNVTGAMHLGHALTCSIEDLIVRWHRMHNKKTLYLPGTDAGGLATQMVVEKMLYRENKTSRHDLGRDEFIKKVWQWKEKYGNQISTQLKSLGASLDWSKEEFTMSKKLEDATQEAFIKCYNDGVITRDNRLVNWCTILQTCISDIECDDLIINGTIFLSVKGHPENNKYEFGTMWSFAYKIDNSDEEIIVATTRPETIFGDTAIAVHPDDPRYKHLHNKYCIHPFLPRKIPIITDSILVDMDLGTGAVKVTPGHDLNDYKCGIRNNLQIINILNDNGTLNNETGEFENMLRYDARSKVIEKLKELKLYRGKTTNEMVLKICSRSGDIIEPILKLQWWMDMKPLAKKLIDAINTRELVINPEWRTHELLNYLNNIQKWCLSRQTWWGNRIPAYQYWKNDDVLNKKWLVAHNLEEATNNAKIILNSDDITVIQDEDVLDTWFGSSIYPFAVLGWPNDTLDMKQFYPNPLLETGHDILFFWVAKMAMMGIKLTGQIPFKEVLLHGIVRDPQKNKMSKSTGNVIDPLSIINGATLQQLNQQLKDGNLSHDVLNSAIQTQHQLFPRGLKECGTDALRFTLCSYTYNSNDINLDINRVEGYRKFCNKIWNAVKFSLMFLPENYVPENNNSDNIFDKYIISKFHDMLNTCNKSFTQYDFINFTKALYTFWFDDFCNVYLEIIKISEHKHNHYPTLCSILSSGLKALHPVMPFITEELWQNIPKFENDNSPSICVSNYPLTCDFNHDSNAIETIEHMLQIVTTIRIYNETNNIPKNGTIQFSFPENDINILNNYYNIILKLTMLTCIEY